MSHSTVLVTSAGSSPAIDVIRCLRKDPSIRVVGADADPWGRRLARTLCDDVVVLPVAKHSSQNFVDALVGVLDQSKIDFVFLGIDVEIEAVASTQTSLPIPSALARIEVLPTLLDKFKTFEKAKLPQHFPSTWRIDADRDLEEAFEAAGGPVWLRPSCGTSGAGAIKADTVQEGLSWISYCQSREKTALQWMAQSFLPGRNVNWSGVFFEGELIASASMLRVAYLLANIAPSGVTGQVKLCETLCDDKVSKVASDVVRVIDPKPHGTYSVDLREDGAGHPCVTEINPRLAGRPWLYANAGVNLPLAIFRVMTGAQLGDAVSETGVVAGLQMYRQVDVEPLFGMADTVNRG